MAWTQLEKARIFEDYWQDGCAKCPRCRAAVHPRRSNPPGGYIIAANCPNGHGELRMHRSDDPKAAQFRAWTHDEFEVLVQDHVSRNRSVCPIDGTVLSFEPFRDDDFVVTCSRCGETRPTCELFRVG